VNFERLYEYRFRGIDPKGRQAVWSEIAQFVGAEMGDPQRLLDPAGGRGEFINAARAAERWFVDLVAPDVGTIADGVNLLTGDIMKMELPSDYFGGIFVSNFLEHLSSQEAVAAFLEKMLHCQAAGGRIAVLGPNFRYCAKDYFDCADHCVALTHVAVAEHLYGAGYEVEKVIPRFLPFSFRGVLPPSAALTRMYLKVPLAWRLIGKQFLVVGRKDS
jgi:hypothetical protein